MRFSHISQLFLSALLLGPAACTEPNRGSGDDTGAGSTGASTSGPGTGTSTDPTTTPTTGTTTAAGTGSEAGTDESTGSGPGSDTETAPDTDGSSGSGTAGEETAGEPTCDGDNMCVAAVPQGWNGPIARIEGVPGAAGECGGAFTDPVFSANAALLADPAVCECSCGVAAGTACPGEVVIAHSGDNAVCSGDGETTHTVSAACSQHNEVGDFFWRVLEPAPEGGACTPSSSTTIPAATWAETVTACGMAEAPTSLGCGDDQLCVPQSAAPFEGGMCIWIEGEQACPVGDYQQQTVYYDDYSDSRTCSECSCGDPTGTCSEPEVRLHPNSTCACSTAGGCNVGTTCEQLSFGTVDSMDLRVPPVLVGEATCAPSDVGPLGDVSPTGATTVCCAG